MKIVRVSNVVKRGELNPAKFGNFVYFRVRNVLCSIFGPVLCEQFYNKIFI